MCCKNILFWSQVWRKPIASLHRLTQAALTQDVQNLRRASGDLPSFLHFSREGTFIKKILQICGFWPCTGKTFILHIDVKNWENKNLICTFLTPNLDNYNNKILFLQDKQQLWENVSFETFEFWCCKFSKTKKHEYYFWCNKFYKKKSKKSSDRDTYHETSWESTQYYFFNVNSI